MSKYIEIDELISAIKTAPVWTGLDAITRIKTLPSIDIVRCKECRWNENTCINHGEMKPRCKFTDYVHTADDFCSYGERKDKEITTDCSWK